MQFDIKRVSERAISVRSVFLKVNHVLQGVLGAGLLFFVVFLYLIWPPHAFPASSLITIPRDASAAEFAQILEEANIIRSEDAFKALARITGYDGHLDSGSYVFQEPATLLAVLWRIGNAKHGIEPVRITITEGMTSFDIADIFEKRVPGFDAEAFLNEASTSEGYLFPETYLFMPGDTSAAIVSRLEAQFDDSVASITPAIEESGHSFEDVVIMASILEREANTERDMRIIAGILWNRIENDMPLQVDAAFGYMHKENGYTPIGKDLDSDSPYNTYRNKGLPPTPISNPGIQSLLAAATPIPTTYVYYLTGNDGLMRYATTFEGHKRNRALYLK